jgi:hypothetical protein
MTKKKVVEDVKTVRKETRTIEVGTTGLSTLTVTLLSDGNIYLNEKFSDPNMHAVNGVFNVAMYIRKEHISSLLSVLLSSGFVPEDN